MSDTRLDLASRQFESRAMLKLVQISDCHLVHDADACYRGVYPQQRLRRVLEHIQTHETDADVLLVTGDVAQEPSAELYRSTAELLDQQPLPWCWIAGNHDDEAQMAAVRAFPLKDQVWAGWQVTLLNSTAEPDYKGACSLADTELQRLANSLAVDRPQLVVVHHHASPTHSAWQDAIALQNAETLLSMLEHSGRKGLLLTGHLHQDWQQPLFAQGAQADWQWLCCPSTAMQYQKGTAVPELESVGEVALPGYRCLSLQTNGDFLTAVKRVTLAP